jgi:hypothetical protein
VKVDRCHAAVVCRLCGRTIPPGEPSALTMVYYQPCRMCPACAVEAREKRLFHRPERR